MDEGVTVTVLQRKPGGELYNFIMSSWLQGTYERLAKRLQVPRGVFFPEHGRLIDRLLGKSVTVYAHVTGEPDMYVGYAVGSAEVVHYVYVKSVWRKCGHARRMAGALVLDDDPTYTHPPLPSLAHKLEAEGWTYNPYRLDGDYERASQEAGPTPEASSSGSEPRDKGPGAATG